VRRIRKCLKTGYTEVQAFLRHRITTESRQCPFSSKKKKKASKNSLHCCKVFGPQCHCYYTTHALRSDLSMKRRYQADLLRTLVGKDGSTTALLEVGKWQC
jgi:hypothetical protein